MRGYKEERRKGKKKGGKAGGVVWCGVVWRHV